MGRVLVVGAGFLGGPLAAALASTGPVRATTRAGEGPAIDGVERVALDLVTAEDDALAAAVADVDAIVLSQAAGRDQDRRAVYLDGPGRLLAAARPGAIARVVFTSSTSALPDLENEVDESCER